MDNSLDTIIVLSNFGNAHNGFENRYLRHNKIGVRDVIIPGQIHTWLLYGVSSYFSIFCLQSREKNLYAVARLNTVFITPYMRL